MLGAMLQNVLCRRHAGKLELLHLQSAQPKKRLPGVDPITSQEQSEVRLGQHELVVGQRQHARRREISGAIVSFPRVSVVTRQQDEAASRSQADRHQRERGRFVAVPMTVVRRHIVSARFHPRMGSVQVHGVSGIENLLERRRGGGRGQLRQRRGARRRVRESLLDAGPPS
jgi:hypothetical protein